MMKRNWTAVAAAVAVLAAGTAAYAIGHHDTVRPAAVVVPAATVTVVGATATIYGAAAAETVIGAPMVLSDLTDTVVVVIEATDTPGSCEIRSGGVRVAYAVTVVGQQAVCVWNRRPV